MQKREYDELQKLTAEWERTVIRYYQREREALDERDIWNKAHLIREAENLYMDAEKLNARIVALQKKLEGGQA